MNKYYARKKCEEILKRMKELEHSLSVISRYCHDENEYYATKEYLEYEKLEQKYNDYSYNCN